MKLFFLQLLVFMSISPSYFTNVEDNMKTTRALNMITAYTTELTQNGSAYCYEYFGELDVNIAELDQMDKTFGRSEVRNCSVELSIKTERSFSVEYTNRGENGKDFCNTSTISLGYSGRRVAPDPKSLVGLLFFFKPALCPSEIIKKIGYAVTNITEIKNECNLTEPSSAQYIIVGKYEKDSKCSVVIGRYRQKTCSRLIEIGYFKRADDCVPHSGQRMMNSTRRPVKRTEEEDDSTPPTSQLTRDGNRKYLDEIYKSDSEIGVDSPDWSLALLCAFLGLFALVAAVFVALFVLLQRQIKELEKLKVPMKQAANNKPSEAAAKAVKSKLLSHVKKRQPTVKK